MKVPLHAFSLAIAGTLICAGCAKHGGGGEVRAPFESPAAGAQDFAEVVRKGDKAALAAMLGPESTPLLNPGDTVQGGNERKSFVQAYESVRVLVPAGPDDFVLEVGAGRW